MKRSTTTTPDKKTKIIKAVLAAAFWAAVWVLLSWKTGQELLLPSPVSVGREFLSLCARGDFWLTILTTLGRIVAGFAAGVAAGTLLAWLTSFFGAADAILSPAVRIVGSTPIASFIILVLLWVDKSWITSFISALTVTPIVWGALSTAIGQTDASLLEMGRAYGFDAVKRLRLIYVPSVLPSWAGACATAMGMAWKSGIAAEVLCQPKRTVGAQLYYSKIYLETPSLFAWTAAVIILSMVLERVFRLAIRRASEK